jgi:DNA polymerase bacteriophage-type
LQNILYIDFETRAKDDIYVVGLDKYARQAKVLMLGWALNNDPVQIWLPPSPIPKKLSDALINPDTLLCACNAVFERLILKYALGYSIQIERFRDPGVLSRHMSMPGNLEDIGEILRMGEDEAKIKDGARLIQLFCTYDKKLAGSETIFGVSDGFGNPLELKDDWAKFISYCKRDVEVERTIWNRLMPFSFPEEQWRDWFFDQHMNEIGLPANVTRAKKLLQMAIRYKEESRKRLDELTGLENSNSQAQLLPWLKERGYIWGSINKKFVEPELKNPESKLTAEAREVLTLRRRSAQSSYTKLEQLVDQISEDGRLKHQYVFMGAARTGRWSAAGVQVMNMPRPEKWFKKMAPEHVYDLIDREAYEEIKKECDSLGSPDKPAGILPFVSSAIRMVFEAPEKYDMVVADLASIEYNVVGWVSRCPAILECIRLKHDPYLDFTPYLFPDKHYTYEWLKEQYDLKNVEVENLRQLAKPPVLGGGFGLGGGQEYINEYGDTARGGMWGYALNVCGVDMPKELAHKAVEIYRRINVEVPKFWEDCEAAFKWVMNNPKETIVVGYDTWDWRNKEWVPVSHNITDAYIEFSCICDAVLGKIVRIKLPSGRYLHYLNCCIEEEEYEYVDKKTGEKRKATGEVIYYEGIEHSATEAEDGSTAKKKYVWGWTKTYGGKLCLAGDTLVLTNHGIKCLTDVSINDKLWDGIKWVQHDGIVCNGEKETITWKGLQATKDHEILAGREWHELQKVGAPYVGLISQWTGLVSVLRLYYSQCQEKQAEAVYNAIAEKFLKWTQGRCGEIKYNRVLPALVEKRDVTDMDFTPLFKTTNCGRLGCIEGQELFLDVTTRNWNPIQITAAEALRCTNLGAQILWNGSNTSQLFQTGINRIWMWIESTMMEIMSQETFDSFRDAKIQTTAAILSSLTTTAKEFLTPTFENDSLLIGLKIPFITISNEENQQSGVSTVTTKQEVFDIRNCGPRHRFTIVTPNGPLIVHNCENIVQAIARDILMNACHLARGLGFQIFGVFHDEIGTLVKRDMFSLGLEDLLWCMRQSPKWAPTIILDAAGWTGKFYHKE